MTDCHFVRCPKFDYYFKIYRARSTLLLSFYLLITLFCISFVNCGGCWGREDEVSSCCSSHCHIFFVAKFAPSQMYGFVVLTLLSHYVWFWSIFTCLTLQVVLIRSVLCTICLDFPLQISLHASKEEEEY